MVLYCLKQYRHSLLRNGVSRPLEVVEPGLSRELCTKRVGSKCRSGLPGNYDLTWK